MAGRVNLPGEVLRTTYDLVLKHNPRFDPEKTGVIIIVSGNGEPPEVSTNMPDHMFKVLEWMVKHAKKARRS